MEMDTESETGDWKRRSGRDQGSWSWTEIEANGDNWHSPSQLIIITVRLTIEPQINQNQDHKI